MNASRAGGEAARAAGRSAAAAEPAPAYRAPRWLPGGHAQTIYSTLRGPRGPRYLRERWDAPDGDFVDIDRIDGDAHAPLVVLFHGLEGSSRSHYARALMRALERSRWRGAVAHFRGCSGELNRLPRAYHSGDSDELDWMLRRFRADAGAAPLFAAGVSLGGNALLKWLGERQEQARGVIAAAAAVSAPLDMVAAGEALERGFNRVYARLFLATLKPKAAQMLVRYPGLFDGEAMRKAGTLREFDDAVTAPLHGFRDAMDYWRRASSRPSLARIRVPTLLLNAHNDPFLPARALPSPEEVSPAVTCVFPREGGHAGFVTGEFPGRIDWLPGRIISLFKQHAWPR